MGSMTAVSGKWSEVRFAAVCLDSANTVGMAVTVVRVVREGVTVVWIISDSSVLLEYSRSESNRLDYC